METEKNKSSKVINVTPNIKIEVVETIDDNKKKGRKPKGGKLIVKPAETVVQDVPLDNIILHLKCSSKDLNEYTSKTNSLATISYNPVVPNIMTYNNNTDNFYTYGDNTTINNNAYGSDTVCKFCKDKQPVTDESTDESVSMKDINAKLKRLKINLYKNIFGRQKVRMFLVHLRLRQSPLLHSEIRI